MLDLRSLVIKLVRRVSEKMNAIAFIEKRGDFFVHTHATKEGQEMLGVSDDFLNKTFAELNIPLNIANKRRKYYTKAWKGEETIFKVDSPIITNKSFYIALFPITSNGETVGLIAYVSPVDMIPKELQKIA